MQTTHKIQSALLGVQIFIGLVQVLTTCFFIKNVRIVGQQEKDARNQILVTQKQVDLAQAQIDLMANQYRESLRPLVAVSLKQEGSNS